MHSSPPSSIHLHPAHFSLHPALWNTLTKILHWANSPSLGCKIKSCSFWLKIGTHVILEALVPNPDLDFWNFDPKKHFSANFRRKSQSCPFFLIMGTHGILTALILVPTLVFWISDPNSIFGQLWAEKVKAVRFAWKMVRMLSRGCWFLFQH